MYNYNNRQYIFKKLSGGTWNIYHDSKSGICYNILTGRNTWRGPVTIERKAYPYFFADMDYRECFHIIYQDLHGNIIYCNLTDDSIAKTPILHSKSPSVYNKHLYLCFFKDNIHFLYVLLYNNNLLFIHQTMINSSVGSPKVIDYVYENNVPISALSDKSGNIYAFYQSLNDTDVQFGYRKFSPDKDSWSNFQAVASPGISTDIKYDFTSIIIDNSNLMHICFQKQNKDKYNFVYKQNKLDENLWSEDYLIHSSIYTFENSSIVSIDNNIFVYWIRNEIIYYRFTKNKGESWSRVLKYNFPTGRNLYCFSYNTNIPYEIERIAIKDIPGNFSNGIKIAFYQDFFGNNIINTARENLQRVFLDSIKHLKDAIDKLSKRIEQLESSFKGFHFSQKNIDKEMDKLFIRISILEDELKKIQASLLRMGNNIKVPEREAKEIFIKQNESKRRVGSYNNTIKGKNIQIRRIVNKRRYKKL